MGLFWTPCLQLTMARIHLLTGAAHSWGCSWTWALLLQKGPKFVTARFSYQTISTWTTIVLLKKYHWYLREIQISNVNTVATLTIFILSQFHVYLYNNQNHSYHLLLSPLPPTEPPFPNKYLSCFIIVCVCDSPHILGVPAQAWVCVAIYLSRDNFPVAALLRIVTLPAEVF